MQAVVQDDERRLLVPPDEGLPKATPLPKAQLFNIYLVRLVEPLPSQVVYPFINQMLVDIGAATSSESVGYVLGIVETATTLAQLATTFFWGTLSDRIGRKPVLVMGCIGSAAGAVLLGFSRSFGMLLVARMVCSGLNGNMAVIKAVVGEITDSSSSARAFSLFPVFLNLGVLLAAIIGGTFSDISRFPGLAAFQLFGTFPYLLPNLMAASITVLAALNAAFSVKETLQSKSVRGTSEDPQLNSRQSLLTRDISAIIFSFGMLALSSGMTGALIPLYCYTPISKGGLGFSSTNIAKAVSFRSMATLLIQLCLFPILQKRVGTLRLYRISLCLFVPIFIGFPVLNRLARAGNATTVWLGLGFLLLTSATANMAYVCNLILITAAAPTKRHLGSLNGYSQVVSGAVNLVGRGGAQALFAFSVDRNLLGGNLVWVVLICCGCLCVLSGRLIRQPVMTAQT